MVTSTSGNQERAQTFVLGHTYTFNPTTVNSFHATFGRRTDGRGPNASGINGASLGIQNLYQATDNFLQVAVNNGGFAVGCGTCALGIFNVTSYQLADDVDILRGKHQIAFGVDLLRTRDIQENHYQDNGVFTFTGQYSNDPLLDFLTGKLSSFSQSGQQLNDLLQNVAGFYVQDTYHATPKLVINAGLRWEPLFPLHDRLNRGSTFSRAAFDARQVSQVFVNAPAGSLFYGDPGISNSFTNRQLTNFSPRLGIVYNPDGNGKTTIRVGGGLLYDSVATFIPVPDGRAKSAFWSSGYQYERSVPVQQPVEHCSRGQSVPASRPGQECRLSHCSMLRYFYRPMSIRRASRNGILVFNIALRPIGCFPFRIWAIRHLTCGSETKPILPFTFPELGRSTTGNTQARRVLSLANPAVGQYYSQMVVADDGVNSNYNGMLTAIEHRFANNYTLLVNYTWSKCLGIAPVTSLSGGVVQDPNNVRGDYGPCTYDSPHLFNASLVYASRFGHGGLAAHLLSNWQIAPLIRYQSGLPVNPVTGKDNSLTGVNNDRPNVVSTTAYTDAPHGLLYQYVNPKLYAANATGTYGNAGHNSLRGPGSFNIDLALSREFGLLERLKLNVRAEAFNVLNHPNFGLPNGNISSSNFGQITTANDPRILQAAVKLIF